MINPLAHVSEQPRQDCAVNVYLHAVVFIIHVLDPGNELTSVEAISDRFVFITLRKTLKD